MALATGQDCRITNIRARRAKPGLMRQHLTALRAAVEVCGAEVEGDALGSGVVVFRPRAVRPGAYRFAVGTAGSATLVLQTVLPALLTAAGPSSCAGGRDAQPWSPPYDFLEEGFLPLVEKMGPGTRRASHVRLLPGRWRLVCGHGGAVSRLAPLALLECEATPTLTARALVASLPMVIAERRRGS